VTGDFADNEALRDWSWRALRSDNERRRSPLIYAVVWKLRGEERLEKRKAMQPGKTRHLLVVCDCHIIVSALNTAFSLSVCGNK